MLQKLKEILDILFKRLEEDIDRMSHINTFRCRAKHCDRSGAPNRKYLPPDLTVAKMWKLFFQENPTNQKNKYACTYSFYHKIFPTNFHLEFGSITMDCCSDCVAFSNKFKATADIETKITLIVEKNKNTVWSGITKGKFGLSLRWLNWTMIKTLLKKIRKNIFRQLRRSK